MRSLVLAAALALCGGCASLGPPTIARDRVDYDHAITTSWKRTMLLNMVKLRYGDTPMFLDVSSIINSYTLEGQVSAGATWPTGAGTGPAIGSVGGLAHYVDKPTITYNPLLGERFTRSMMTPLQPAVVVSLIQSGWAADTVMNMMVSSANGVYNRFGSGGRARGADPQWATIVNAMRRIQASAAVGMRIENDKGHELTVLVLHRNNETAEIAQEMRTLRGALGISTEAKELHVVYGSVPKGDAELALVTRSMLEILIDLASAIEVPPDDVARGIVPPVPRFESDAPSGYKPLVRIHSGAAPPERPFVGVEYHGHWFWIDESDYPSKGIFSFVMMVFSLMDTAPKGQPLITVPAS